MRRHPSTVTILERFTAFYETFSASWLERLPELYAPAFVFEDAFHRVDGDYAALRAYLGRVLEALHESKFYVEDIATGRDGAYVRWRWEWRRKASDDLHVVPGVTHLRLEGDRITYHRDIFDAASGFYETLPVIGRVLRSIKKRI